MLYVTLHLGGAHCRAVTAELSVVQLWLGLSTTAGSLLAGVTTIPSSLQFFISYRLLLQTSLAVAALATFALYCVEVLTLFYHTKMMYCMYYSGLPRLPAVWQPVRPGAGLCDAGQQAALLLLHQAAGVRPGVELPSGRPGPSQPGRHSPHRLHKRGSGQNGELGTLGCSCQCICTSNFSFIAFYRRATGCHWWHLVWVVACCPRSGRSSHALLPRPPPPSHPI